MFRRVAIAALAMLLPHVALAATTPAPLTLAGAIARVQTSGFDVRLAQTDVDASIARVTQARAQLLPQVGVSGLSTNGGIAQFGMPIAQQTYLSFTGSVPIFEPAQAATTRSAALAAQATTFDLARSRNDAVLLVTQAYERALLADAMVATQRVSVRYQQQRTAYVDLRVRAGAAPRYEHSQAESALVKVQQSLEDAIADRDQSIADLEAILDLPIDSTLQLGDSLAPLPGITSLDDLLARALKNRPELASAKANVDAAGARLSAARAQYLPVLSANAQTYSGHSLPNLGASGYQVGVTASLPLLDGGARTGQIRDARAQMRRATILLEQARRSVERDVANAWSEYQVAQRDLALVRIQAAAAADELRITTLRERSGKGIALETLAALSDDAGAREDLLRATARYNDAVAAMHHADCTSIF
jgi:outer membrane protein TolC